MHKYKSLPLFAVLLMFQPVWSQKTADVIKKVLKATSDFQNYDIQFEKYFKFQSEKDTVKETYHSVVYRTDIEYNIGWHRIYQEGMVPKSVVASNTSEVARLNFKDNMYYSLRLADDEKKVINSVQLNIYHPLTRYKEDYKGFEVLDKDKHAIWLQKIDTVKDAAKKVKLVNKILIGINPDTYIPESEETWVWFRNGGVQYSRFKLLSHHMRPKNQYASVLKTSDSLITYIKSFTNGDSLRAKNKKVYKQVRIGDTAFVFNGILHAGNKPYDFSQNRDSIVIIDFFYTTCAPCITGVVEINKVYNRNKGKGVGAFGIDPFSSDWPNLAEFVKERGINYPIVKTKQELVLEYGVTGYPRLFIIKNGIIVKIYYGFNKEMDKLLQAEIDALLKG
jgi:peroxiredoxin